MFDSNEYSWADVQVVMLGRPVTGIRGIRYKISRTKTNIYAKGSDPHSRTRGNKEYEGEINLLQSELEAIQKGLKKGQDITDVKPFDIVVSYAPEDGGSIVTDILKAVEFTEVEKSLNQNDPFMELTLPLIVGKIQKNV
jgi:hypothetical protein